MFDLHNHLIFGVDDGSKNIEESIEMIGQLMESGFQGAVVTPHYDRGRYVVEADLVKSKLEILKEELDNRGIIFELYPGNEVQIDDRTIRDLNDKKIMTMNESKYILSELPMVTTPHYAKGIFYELQLSGYIPVIAHPERYAYVKNDIDFLLDYIRTGCLVQINLDSLTDKSSETVKKLLERNMVHFVGTDAHSKDWRNGLVKKELETLRGLVGDEKYDVLTTINPKKLIEDKFISSDYDKVVKSEEKKKNRSWFKFWGGR